MRTDACTLPPHIALIGPTACGKSAAALAIAGKHPVEIISVDSALVYRSMDIGTAKPLAAELARVPHHLIDIRDPREAYSAADFVSDARCLMHAITARGKLPLLVGGTMLYLKTLLEGLDDMPRADPAVRQRIAQQAASMGWPALHAELAVADPLTAARLAPGDTQRIARALEVYRISGQPLSHFQTGPRDTRQEQPPADRAATTRHLLISLEPEDRAWLHQRIAMRFDAMLAAGFLDEVRHLRNRSDLHAELPSMRCVGYRQAWQALDGQWPLPELRERGIIATRQLAKRQITWLRATPQRVSVPADQPDALARVMGLVDDFVDCLA